MATTLQPVIKMLSTVITANGQTGWALTNEMAELLCDINLSSLRGDGPEIVFVIDRLGLDGIAYPMHTFTAATQTSKISADFGSRVADSLLPGEQVRLRWEITGDPIATTVTTGATSATQTLGSTTGMAAGDTLHFDVANVDRVIDHVVDGTHVVLTASVASTTDEDVTVSNTPDFTVSASVLGRE